MRKQHAHDIRTGIRWAKVALALGWNVNRVAKASEHMPALIKRAFRVSFARMIIKPDSNRSMDIYTALSENMAARLTRPLSKGWSVAVPYHKIVSECDICGARAVFVRVDAAECSAWVMRGIDGADRTPYGIFCHLHT